MRTTVLDRDLYRLYMEDAEAEYMGEAVAKEDIYRENYFFQKNLVIPIVHNILSSEANQEALFELIGGFMEANATALSAAGPIYQIPFDKKMIDSIYDLFAIDKDFIMKKYYQMVDETYVNGISKVYEGFITNAPHKILLTAILVDGIQRQDQNIIDCAEYLWGWCEYPILFKKYFPITVKEDVMAATIEHLSSKFKIKKVGSLLSLLKYDTHVCVERFYEEFMVGEDHTYMDFIQRMRNQLNSTFKNLANAYKKTSDANMSMHSTDKVRDDGSIVDETGYETTAAMAIENTINRFSTGGISPRMVSAAAEGCEIDAANLTGMINQIYKTKNNRLDKMVENIITVYFNKNPTSTNIGSNEFVTFGLSLYRSLGASGDPMYREINEILTYWMNDVINISSIYSSNNTIIRYRRAVFNYIIFMIMQYN